MYAQVEKSKENKSRAIAKSLAQKKSNVKQGFGFIDNRPNTITQRKLQEVINGAQTKQLKNTNDSVIQRVHCGHCNRDVRDSDQHDLNCPHYSVRTFQTVEDERRGTRSHSFDRRHRSGSFDRVHEHENDYPGGRRFEHVIGHTDRNGNYQGR